MEKNKKKQLIVSIVAIVLLIVATVGVTYAFFNYTRTGTANTVSVGRIAFNSSQDGRINLTNIFPIDPTETGIMNDAIKVGTVAITVTGDTTYDKGVEYLVSAVNVSNTVGTKTIPISISATTSGTLGTSDENYFDDRDTATSHIYKVLAKDTISNNDQLMVGYIGNNATGINGTITIKAYVDKNKIAISDTYNGVGAATDENGTSSTWVDSRTVFTTTEWNSLSSTGISFQVKVEANEGVWVEEKLSRNDMKKIDRYSGIFTNEQRSSITEINFIKMSETNINSHNNLIDLTLDGGNGVVKAWIENNKLYIASPGETYFPTNSQGLFGYFTVLQTISFDNINTSLVTDMGGMFAGCSSLINLNLQSFNTESVTSMAQMFDGCSNLSIVDLSSFVTNGLNVTALMFNNCTNLETIYVSNNWNLSNVNTSPSMFFGCTSLKGGGTPQTTYDANHVDKEYARIDGGANSSTPGYLTLKTN